MRSKNFIVNPVIYPFDIMVSVDESVDVLKKRLIRVGLTSDDIGDSIYLPETVVGRYIMFPSNQSLIILRRTTYKQRLIETIIHESFHATHAIMDKVGMQLSIENDEAFAYLLGFISGSIFKELKV